jgi:hypothetical protein
VYDVRRALSDAARAIEVFARFAALVCLLASLEAVAGATVDLGTWLTIATLVTAACFWPRGGGIAAFICAVLALAVAWSMSARPHPSASVSGLGAVGLLLLGSVATSRFLWGDGLGTTRSRVRVALAWVTGGTCAGLALLAAAELGLPLRWAWSDAQGNAALFH